VYINALVDNLHNKRADDKHMWKQHHNQNNSYNRDPITTT